jgi:hypothetical protein
MKLCDPDYSATQECSNKQRLCLCVSQCGYRRMQAVWANDMENLEWLPPQKLGGN